jgi:hypothetical protein
VTGVLSVPLTAGPAPGYSGRWSLSARPAPALLARLARTDVAPGAVSLIATTPGSERLAAEADLIVSLLPADDADCAAVTQAHRRLWPGKLAS